MTPNAPLLIAENLHAGYLPGVDILRGIDLTLNTGELVGIIGPNGAGKSTFIKAIFGLVEVRSGLVKLNDDTITDLPAHELVVRGVGYVPQRNNVFPSLTVGENLRMGLYLDPQRWNERYPVVVDLFPLLAERESQKAGLLSGGERQMVAMGRALMLDPTLLLLDEPSAGLSPTNQDLVFERVRQIADSGVSILMVEQNANMALSIADRGYVLLTGRIVLDDSAKNLLANEDLRKAYLGEAE